MELASSKDLLLEGRHFFPDVDPYTLGHKSLAVSLSDLAAMGATPQWALLSLTLPRQQAQAVWIDRFMQGWQALAAQYQVALVGGDTTSGEQLTISVTLMGQRPASANGMLRSGAQDGDDLWVSGHIGAAGLALSQRIANVPSDAEIARRLHRPDPRVALGSALSPKIHACIDISDGLFADCQHILTASGGLGAQIDWEAISMLADVRNWAIQTDWYRPLIAGDDYELLFTASSTDRAFIEQQAQQVGVTVSRIGRISRDLQEIAVYRSGQKLSLPAARGFDHFTPSDTMAIS
jgi:thiamine-monophosphate kinase